MESAPLRVLMGRVPWYDSSGVCSVTLPLVPWAGVYVPRLPGGSRTRPDSAKCLPTLAISSPTPVCHLSSCPEHRLHQCARACLAQVRVAARRAVVPPHGFRNSPGPCAVESPDGRMRGTMTAAGQYHGRVTPLRLSHRTGSCLGAPALRRRLPRSYLEATGLGMRSASRTCLPAGLPRA
jgi:hypothetical protein